MSIQRFFLVGLIVMSGYGGSAQAVDTPDRIINVPLNKSLIVQFIGDKETVCVRDLVLGGQPPTTYSLFNDDPVTLLFAPTSVHISRNQRRHRFAKVLEGQGNIPVRPNPPVPTIGGNRFFVSVADRVHLVSAGSGRNVREITGDTYTLGYRGAFSAVAAIGDNAYAVAINPVAAAEPETQAPAVIFISHSQDDQLSYIAPWRADNLYFRGATLSNPYVSLETQRVYFVVTGKNRSPSIIAFDQTHRPIWEAVLGGPTEETGSGEKARSTIGLEVGKVLFEGNMIQIQVLHSSPSHIVDSHVFTLNASGEVMIPDSFMEFSLGRHTIE